MQILEEDNKRLVEQFGASRVSELKELPDFYTFNNGLMYSHRDFDKYFAALKKGEKCSIVTGFNASAAPHIGHISVFDTNLFFQKKYGVSVFIPISDDESYVSGKVKTQEEGLRNSLVLAKSMVAFGYDLGKTKLIIDQLYTDIYNLAVRFSRGVTLSQIKAVYGYSSDQNIGLHFYPTVQAAHVLFPETLGIPNVLVPIGPDEDSHLRTCRDLADKFGYRKPAVLHSVFMPGLDGEKMSKSRGNAIFLLDDEKEIKKKIMSAFSGGATSTEEHRKKGGNPDVDMAYLYLKSFFLTAAESKKIYDEYKSGKLLSGEMKQLLLKHVLKRTEEFKERYQKVTAKDLEKIILTNEGVDIAKLADKLSIFD
jgi:tryptophanyl-tRNA synthetase